MWGRQATRPLDQAYVEMKREEVVLNLICLHLLAWESSPISLLHELGCSQWGSCPPWHSKAFCSIPPWSHIGFYPCSKKKPSPEQSFWTQDHYLLAVAFLIRLTRMHKCNNWSSEGWIEHWFDGEYHQSWALAWRQFDGYDGVHGPLAKLWQNKIPISITTYTRLGPAWGH